MLIEVAIPFAFQSEISIAFKDYCGHLPSIGWIDFIGAKRTPPHIGVGVRHRLQKNNPKRINDRFFRAGG